MIDIMNYSIKIEKGNANKKWKIQIIFSDLTSLQWEMLNIDELSSEKDTIKQFVEGKGYNVAENVKIYYVEDYNKGIII